MVHQRCSTRERAHRDFFCARGPKLPRDENVERRVQRARDLIGDRDATARQREDHRPIGPVRSSCAAKWRPAS